MFFYKQDGETIGDFSRKIKKKLKCNKVCICGKLDPMARGITRILIDRETKLMSKYLSSIKEYEFYIVLNIKSDSDDILGIVKHTPSKDNNIKIEKIKNYINNLKYKNYQKFHHYSSINIKKNNLRKPVWYWYKQNMLLDSDIPYKAIKVYNHQFIEKKTIDFKEYISYVLERLKKVKDVNFNVPKIIKSWKSLQVQKITMLKFRLTVSSGFYIRMISKELKSLGINTHIFDIHRTKVLD